MDNKIIVHGTIHGSDEIQQEIKAIDVAEYIGSGIDNVDVYYFQPEPGEMYNAGFNWQLVLSTAADVIAVGGVLWAAYEKFFATRKKKSETTDSTDALYILVGYPEGQHFEFHLGKDAVDREKFIELFTKAVSEAQKSPQHKQMVKTIIKELDKSKSSKQSK